MHGISMLTGPTMAALEHVLNVSLLLKRSSHTQAYGIGRCYRKTRRAARWA